MKYVSIGKIVNTHGIKGEIRLLSDFKFLKKVFVKDFPIYIGEIKEKQIINSYRPHKQFHMITLKGYTNINEVLKYKGKNAYILRSDLNLENDEFLDEDLIDLNVIYQDKIIGQVIGFENHSINKIINVKSVQSVYKIPFNFAIIENIDLEKKCIYIKNIKGLINNE